MSDTTSPQATRLKPDASASKKIIAKPESLMAPPDVLVWYLAVFRRLFVGMESASESEDLEEAWLYMWAADAVHNVPGEIRHYYDPTTYRDPESQAEWILRFPDFLMELGAPDRHYEPARRLVTQEGAVEELELPDLASADFAPRAELDKQLDTLFHFCIYTRQRLLPREALDDEGWRVCEMYRRNNGVLGRVAKRLPLGLVHWSEFDAVQFEADVEKAYSELKPWEG